MSNVDIKFEEMFLLTTTALRINRSHYSIPRDVKWMLQFLFVMSSNTLTFVFLINSIISHDIKQGKISEACKNGVMVIVGFTSTMKYFVLLYHQQSMIGLISTVNKDYDIANGYCQEEKGIVLKYAKKGVTVSWYWLVFGFGTGAIFPIKAFVLMSYYYWNEEFVLVQMFDFITFPDRIETNKFWVFVILFILCFIFGNSTTSMLVGFDPLVPIFMLHICGQLELLSLRISEAFVEDVNETKENLKNIIIKLQTLYEFMSRIKNNFHVYYEYNMKATTFILPLTMFQLIEDVRNGRLSIEFLSFFGGCILHFYMPCYYCDFLMEMCENIRQSIYSCGWEKHPDKGVRQIVLFMITRARIPMGISTVFYLINLDTFAEMCRQSYAILGLINASSA